MAADDQAEADIGVQYIEITGGGRCYRIDLNRKELCDASGRPVKVTPQQWGLLNCFVKNPRALLSNDNLHEKLWSGVPVNPEAISQAVRALRAKLEDKKGKEFIETESRKGYRFIATVTHAEDIEDYVVIDPAVPSQDWHPDKAEAYTDLAALQVHAPRPLNSRADCYYLDASLRFDVAEHVIGNRTVAIGLSKANLTLASPAFQIAHASLLGGTARPRDGVAAGTGGITVSALPGETMLEGSPLGDYHLAVIEPVGTGEAVVTLTLSAAARSFVFTLIDDETNAPVGDVPSLNKDAILNLIYGETLAHRRDSATGRLALARASVRRKPAK